MDIKVADDFHRMFSINSISIGNKPGTTEKENSNSPIKAKPVGLATSVTSFPAIDISRSKRSVSFWAKGINSPFTCSICHDSRGLVYFIASLNVQPTLASTSPTSTTGNFQALSIFYFHTQFWIPNLVALIQRKNERKKWESIFFLLQ